MRYANTNVDERLIPMMQCTRTFPEETDKTKGGLEQGLGLINIIHGCPSHTVALLFFFLLSLLLPAKNSPHNLSPLFI